MMPREKPLLEVNDLAVHFNIAHGMFPRRSHIVRAVDGVSFDIAASQTFGLVGESGSGKSTIGKALLRLVAISRGTVALHGESVHALQGRMLAYRRDVQVVFQDPYASLNPSMTVSDIVGEPLTIHYGLRGAAREERVAILLERVGLRPDQLGNFPAEFSGGQRQRIAIARALALSPRLIVCDEPVSALDVSTQSQVIGLFEELQASTGVSYLFIAHDLAVVRHMSDNIGVMYRGKLVEAGPSERIYEAPAHPYTQTLLAAIPVTDPVVQRQRRQERQRLRVTRSIPLTDSTVGCPFQSRCVHVTPTCRIIEPPRVEVDGGGWTTCHLYT